MESIPLLRPFLTAIKDKGKLKTVTKIIDNFEQQVTANINNLPKQAIHGDLNEGNVLLSKNGTGETSTHKIYAFIDFNNCTTSCRVFDVSVAMAYMSIFCHKSPVESSGEVIAGYLSESELSKEELNVIYVCVLGRICQSLVNGAYRHEHVDSDNEFILETAKTGWEVLETFTNSGEVKVLKTWDEICLRRLGRVYFQNKN